MLDVVIDANVWIVADRLITEGLANEEVNCIKTCREWLERFVNGVDRLLVDWSYQIILEYRKNIRKNGFAEQLLNRLETESTVRLVGVQVEFDNNGHAALPETIFLSDPADRKFVAVALASDPKATIFVATDRGWSRDKSQLEEIGLKIYDLCPDYK